MPSSARDDAAAKASLDTTSADERTLCEHPSDDDDYSGRPSAEVSDGDHDILESEDERERLLTQKEGISGLFNKKGVRIGKRQRNTPTTKERKRSSNGETSALMYEMEEGHGMSASSLSHRSSESDERRLLATKTHRKACRVAWLHCPS
jgi:hypothetical protein